MKTISLTPIVDTEPGLVAAGSGLVNPRHLIPRTRTFQPSDWDILARYWHPVIRVQDVADKPVPVTLLDLELIVYRTSSGIRVARDLCPHRGAPLSQGTLVGDELVCVYHGLHYGADGRCTKLPAHPQTAPSARLAITQFPAVERYGLVWTCLSPSGPIADIPPFPHWDEAGYQNISPASVDMVTSAGRQVEGFIDVAHFAWIHDTSFADRNAPEVPHYELETTDHGFKFDYLSDVSNYPKKLQHLEPPGFQWMRRFEAHPPFAATLTVCFPEGKSHHILNVASPVGAHRTRLFSPVARNFVDIGTPQDAAEFKTAIVHEDKTIAESQYPLHLPLDIGDESHFASDRASLAYRAALRRLGLSLLPATR